MGGGGPDDDRSLVSGDRPDAMPQHDAFRPEPLSRRPLEFGEEPGRRSPMGFVIECIHPTPGRRIGSDPPREHDDSPESRSFEGTHRGRVR